MENKTKQNTASRPVKKNGYSNKIRLAKKQKRREEAKERQNKYTQLTLNEKITRAQKRRGKSESEIKQLKALGDLKA